jgi:25S rRNA (uracil2634-N3)-methyltransferase
MLQSGSTPSFTSTRRKKVGSDDENEDDAIGNEDGNDVLSQTETRGTVLITLRNVSPYTEWLVKFACTRNPISILNNRIQGNTPAGQEPT